MKFRVYLLETCRVDVRIDLCGRDTGVTKHLLDLAQVGTTREEMSGKTVP